jgi:hypothetical protein
LRKAVYQVFARSNVPGARELLDEARAAMEDESDAAREAVAPELKLPPVVFCETHDDPSHIRAMRTLLPFLQAEGHKVVTYELDQDIDRETLIEAYLRKAEDLAHKLAAMTNAADKDRVYKRIQRSLAVSELFEKLPHYGMDYEGLDAAEMTKTGLRSSHMFDSLLLLEERDAIIAGNLARLIREHEGGVVGCIGAAHAFGVRQRLERRLTREAAEQVIFVRIGSLEEDKERLKAYGVSLDGITYIERLSESEGHEKVADAVREIVEVRQKAMQGERESAGTNWADKVRAEESAAMTLEDVSGVCYRVDELKRSEGRQ